MSETTSATRPTDHSGLEILTPDECRMLLSTEPVGRIAFVHEGEPVILPVNHRVDGRSIVFRTNLGAKLSAAVMERPVAFEVDGYDARTRSGWSVLARGTAEAVVADDVIERLEALDLIPWATSANREHWVRIVPDEITGRRIPPAPTLAQTGED